MRGSRFFVGFILLLTHLISWKEERKKKKKKKKKKKGGKFGKGDGYSDGDGDSTPPSDPILSHTIPNMNKLICFICCHFI
jgi:hypothetical protein